MSIVKKVKVRYNDTRHCPHIGRGPINKDLVVTEAVYLFAKVLGYKITLVTEPEVVKEAPEPTPPKVKEKVKTEEKMVKADLPKEPEEQELTSRVAKVNGVKSRVFYDANGKAVKVEPLEEVPAEKTEAKKEEVKAAPKKATVAKEKA